MLTGPSESLEQRLDFFLIAWVCSTLAMLGFIILVHNSFKMVRFLQDHSVAFVDYRCAQKLLSWLPFRYRRVPFASLSGIPPMLETH